MIYFSHTLPKEDNGTYLNFWVRLWLTSGVASLGISLLIFSYAADVLHSLLYQLKKRHYWLYGLFLGAVALTFAWSQSSGFPDARFYLYAVFFAGYVLNVLLEALLMVTRKYKLLTVVSGTYFLIFLFIHFYVCRHGYHLDKILLYLLPLIWIKLGILLYAFHSFMRSKTFVPLKTMEIKRARNLWLHLGLYNLYSVLFQWVDKYVLSFILTAAVSAVYFNATVNIPFLPLAFSAVSSALLMQLNAQDGIRNPRQNITDLHYASGLLSSVAFPVFAYLAFFRSELFHVIFSDKYEAAVPIFLCSILIIPVRSFDFVAILQTRHKGRIINLGAAMDLVLACALMYPLYLVMGLPGVALSFVISTYLQCIFYLYYSGKVLRVNMWSLIPWQKWLYKLVLFVALAFTLHLVFLGSTELISLIAGGTVIAAVAAATLWYEFRVQQKRLRTTVLN